MTSLSTAGLGAPTDVALDAHHTLRPLPYDVVLVSDGIVEVFLASTAEPPVAPRHVVTLLAGHALPGTIWAGELSATETIELVGNGPATVRIFADAATSAGPAGNGVDPVLAAQLGERRAELAGRMAHLREPEGARERVLRRVAVDELRRNVADAALAGLLARDDAVDPATADASPQLRALLVAAHATGLSTPAGAVESARADAGLDLPALAGRLRIPIREVDLSGPWWREDGIQMVALDADGNPTALVRRRRHWRTWSTVDGWRDVPANGDGRVFTKGWCLYPALPARPLRLGDVLRTGLPPGAGRDLWRLGASALVVSVLGAAVPLAAASIIGESVPRADGGNILAVVVLVAGLTVAFTAASVMQGVLLQRLVVQMNLRTTAALWARVLRLDPPFFRGFSPGELARRVLAVDGIRDLVTSSVIAGGIGALIGITGVVVTVVLDVGVGLAALAALVCYGAFAWYELRRMVHARRQEVNTRNAISGFVTALLSGIVKVRVANAESRVYARWAMLFARERDATAAALAAQRQLSVVTAAMPTIATLLIVAVATYVKHANLSIGVFVGLVAGLTQVTTALSLVVPALSQLTEAVPLYDAARPVLRAAPRVVADAADPGVLRGVVEVSKASFAYSEDAPLTLSSVDLVANPGEFVAVVGPSGAGKSTLIRLLLGFDRPTSGAVLFDGKPLDTLDVEAVRRQIGVVTQNAQVPSGSMLTALIGTSNLTVDDAWQALEMAGLAADVRQMPMGIRTIISDGGSTFSGGQRQRLMIAKALVRRPKILIFDEATSALDNVTQAMVTRSLEQLNATRVVIAHRLSTIQDARRIYVMQRGRIVEQGEYGELLTAGGLFTTLARRQIA